VVGKKTAKTKGTHLRHVPLCLPDLLPSRITPLYALPSHTGHRSVSQVDGEGILFDREFEGDVEEGLGLPDGDERGYLLSCLTVLTGSLSGLGLTSLIRGLGGLSGIRTGSVVRLNAGGCRRDCLLALED
jgi:hypothetical protein